MLIYRYMAIVSIDQKHAGRKAKKMRMETASISIYSSEPQWGVGRESK